MESIQMCLKRMIEAHKILGAAKEEAKETCEAAYLEFTKTIVIGDEDPPSLKALEKLAKAMAVDNLEKFSNTLKDEARALLQSTGEPSMPLFDRN